MIIAKCKSEFYACCSTEKFWVDIKCSLSLQYLLLVGSTNVTNVTTLGVVFYQQQMSKHIHDHQQQMSNHNERHMVFWHENNKRQRCHKIKLKQNQVYLHVGRYDILLFGNTNNVTKMLHNGMIWRIVPMTSYMCVLSYYAWGVDNSNDQPKMGKKLACIGE